MKLTFLGANRNVTGSRYCLEVAGSQVMIDCGLVQERDLLARNWEPCPIAASQIDALLVTHAHIDHIGLIPRFVSDGFRGSVFATRPTVALADVMLKDSAKIQAEDAKYKKRRHRKEGRQVRHPVVPLYTRKDVTKAMKQFHGVNYLTPREVAPGITATWHDAGHILGSAALEITAQEKGQTRSLVFSGDLGQTGKPLVGDPTVFQRADFVVMESTYGDRDHASQEGGIEQQLESIVNQTIRRGGNVVIPVFALERAQEMMYYFSRLVHENLIPDVPIILDSPLAYDATTIFRKFESWLDEETKTLIESDQPPLHFPGLRLVRTAEDSRATNDLDRPCIIMAPAGMCNAGRIKHHLRANVGRAESTILFVGFQAKGTLGRRLISGEDSVRIHGREYQVNAEIRQSFGMSAHADRSALLSWLRNFEVQPRSVFLTHGEEEAALSLQSAIEEQLHFEVHVPRYGETYELLNDGAHLVEMAEAAVEKESKPQPLASTAASTTESTTKSTAASTADSTVAPIAATPPPPAENPDLEFLDSSVRRSVSFMHEDPWRVLRIHSDTIQAIDFMTRALRGRRRSISVFGSARLPETDPAYVSARHISRRLGERGFAIITGGGPGIMEAGNRGARDAKALSIGLNIELPHEQTVNPYCDVSYTCRYFFVRKTMFAKYSSGFAIFPGGFGTLDELFESLTLIQTGRLARFPVVLVGTEYWAPLVDWLRSGVLEHGCISKSDLDRFLILDDPEEIADRLDRVVDGNNHKK